MFIVLHQHTKTNPLYVKTYMATNLNLILVLILKLHPPKMIQQLNQHVSKTVSTKAEHYKLHEGGFIAGLFYSFTSRWQKIKWLLLW